MESEELQRDSEGGIKLEHEEVRKEGGEGIGGLSRLLSRHEGEGIGGGLSGLISNDEGGKEPQDDITGIDLSIGDSASSAESKGIRGIASFELERMGSSGISIGVGNESFNEFLSTGIREGGSIQSS